MRVKLARDEGYTKGKYGYFGYRLAAASPDPTTRWPAHIPRYICEAPDLRDSSAPDAVARVTECSHLALDFPAEFFLLTKSPPNPTISFVDHFAILRDSTQRIRDPHHIERLQALVDRTSVVAFTRWGTLLERITCPQMWVWNAKIWQADSDLEELDVLALLNAADKKKRRHVEKAHTLLAMNEQTDLKTRRHPIPHEVKLSVWRRDQGRCVECESQESPEFDHIIPLALGGANSDRNLQLLCADCNRRKGASLG